MNIVCASSVLKGEEIFSTLGHVDVIPDKNIAPAHLQNAEALIVRTSTDIDPALLTGSTIQFVGTATAGYEHMDLDYLNDAGIAWCAAPGCNARSVAEYVMTSLLVLASRHGFTLGGKTIGIIGVGHVGSLVVNMARSLEMHVLQNDPPRFEASGNPIQKSREDVLHQADIITLHVPLTHEGPYATHHMANVHFFEHLKAGSIFVNTSRGDVLDTEALLFALDQGVLTGTVLDVWEGEPFINRTLLEKADLGTTHVAGYSLDGRLAGTLSVYQQACNFFEVEPTWNILESDSIVSDHHIDATAREDEEVVLALARNVCDVEGNDQHLRAGATEEDQEFATHFLMMRKEYPDRFEFHRHRVHLHNGTDSLTRKLTGLGFCVETDDDPAGA